MKKKLDHPFFDALEFIGRTDSWDAFSGGGFPRPQFRKALREAHPFVFHKSVTNEKLDLSQDLSNLTELVSEFSLPHGRSLYLLNGANRIRSGNLEFRPLGYLIEEVTPEVFRIYALAKYDLSAMDGMPKEAHMPPALDYYELDLRKPSMENRSEICFLLHLTNAISVKRLGIEVGGSRTVKDKSSMLGMVTVKCPNLYHVADKQEYRYWTPDDTGEVNWEFRGFWRGHWRAFYVHDSSGKHVVDSRGRNVVDYGKTGKNRQGEYTVPGYTWVSEHVKGDPRFAEIRVHKVVPGK